MRLHWPTLRLWLGLGVLVVLAAVAIALLTPEPTTPDRPLDPQSAKPNGARAVAQVLGRQGVDVQRTERIAAVTSGDRDRTLVVIDSAVLDDEHVRQLPDLAGRLVLVDPNPRAMDLLGAPIAQLPGVSTDPDGVAASCPVRAARAAGTVVLSGTGYRTVDGVDTGDVTLCFPASTTTSPAEPGTGLIADWTYRGTHITAVGSTEPFTNRDADEPGRATLAFWFLGEHEQLTWWLVDPYDPGLMSEDGTVDPTSLLPRWVGAAFWWLVVTAVLAMIWQGRRLGRLVPEPLPVIVRSAETGFGRAALYREVRARGRAFELVRRRTLAELRRQLGLGRRASFDEVVAAAAQITGMPAPMIGQLLTPAEPTTDADLVTHVQHLDALVTHVRERRNPAPESPTPTPAH